MTYRSLLVLLGNDARCAVRTQVAIDLARRFEAHLVGLAPTGLVDLPIVSDPSGSMGDLMQIAWTALRDDAVRAADTFDAACRRAGLPSFETVVDETDQVASMVRHAHCSDLCIVSQAPLDGPNRRRAGRAVEQMVLDGARPTLVLPDVGDITRIGPRALVAWDDSRESARALSDALPLLRLASQVDVVHWVTSMADDASVQRKRLGTVQRWLMWQGVAAEVRTEPTDIGVADAMLSLAANRSADLIVMGAYGHARWAERMLGGATRGILDAMTVPVLMSH